MSLKDVTKMLGGAVAAGVVFGLAMVASKPDYDAMRDQSLQMYINGMYTCSAVAVTPTKVLTAGHCIARTTARQSDITLRTYDGETYAAEVEKVNFVSPGGRSDQMRDIAMLTVSAGNEGHPAKEIADRPLPSDVVASMECGQQNIGETVFVVGSPADAVAKRLNWAVTEGKVISTDARVQASEKAWLQTDALMWHGNSGGPLFDAGGQLVGIVSHGNMARGAPVGHNYAVSAPRICAFAQDAVKAWQVSVIENGHPLTR